VESRKITQAWREVFYKGKLELGKCIVSSTPQYNVWFRARLEGANPFFAPPNPMVGFDL